jgi:hypothetical protein
MSLNGVIAISRKLFDPDDAFFGGEPFTRREAWQWLIAQAAYKPRTVRVRVGRKVSSVHLDRGQVSHSRAFMSDAWGWTDKTVRTFLDRLELDGRIERSEGQQTGQHQTIITICKYDEYQFGATDVTDAKGQQRASKVEKRGQEKGQQTGQQKGQQTDAVSVDETDTISADIENAASEGANETASEKGQQTQKKGPEEEEGLDKKRKNTRSRAGEPSGFEEWYATYPRKKSPKDAARAYAKVITGGEITEADLLARTKTFAASWAGKTKEQRQFIPYPASWLNAGSYADEPEGASEPNGAPPAARDPATFTSVDWQRRLDHHGRTGEWAEHWGPALGEAGCLVPAAMLHERTSRPDPPTFNGAN